MKYAATTTTVDGATVTGHGNTYPEAIRAAAQKAKQHNETLSQYNGVGYVHRDRVTTTQR